MKLASPVEASDFLLISKSRLISSLFRLGMLIDCSNINDLKQNDIVQKIDLLWEESRANFDGLQLNDEIDDLEAKENDNDLIELGALKLTLYAAPYNKPTWFSKFCMPCADNSKAEVQHQRSLEKAKTMKRKKQSGGELVRHEIPNCPLCSNIMGCPLNQESEKENSPRRGGCYVIKKKQEVAKKDEAAKKDRVGLDVRVVSNSSMRFGISQPAIEVRPSSI